MNFRWPSLFGCADAMREDVAANEALERQRRAVANQYVSVDWQTYDYRQLAGIGSYMPRRADMASCQLVCAYCGVVFTLQSSCGCGAKRARA